MHVQLQAEAEAYERASMERLVIIDPQPAPGKPLRKSGRSTAAASLQEEPESPEAWDPHQSGVTRRKRSRLSDEPRAIAGVKAEESEPSWRGG